MTTKPGSAPIGAPELKHFVIRSDVTFKHGPLLADGVPVVDLVVQPHLTIRYQRYAGDQIIVQTQVSGAVGGGKETFKPPGILHIESRLAWPVPVDGTDVNAEHRLVRLTEPALSQAQQRVNDLVHSAIAAFELATDAYTEVWRANKQACWETEDGIKFGICYGSAEVESMPATVIGEPERERFGPLLDVLRDANNGRLRSAYSVARLNRDHLAPATRVVFGWALIERLCRHFIAGVQLTHKEVMKAALRHCNAAVQAEERPVVTWDRVRGAIKQAYALRNGLAHGEPQVIKDMDFPALARATALLARQLARTRRRR